VERGTPTAPERLGQSVERWMQRLIPRGFFMGEYFQSNIGQTGNSKSTTELAEAAFQLSKSLFLHQHLLDDGDRGRGPSHPDPEQMDIL